MNKYAAVLLLAGFASAQTTQPQPTVPEQIVYEFKNVDLTRAAAIVNFVQQLMNGRVQIQVDTAFKTAIIRRGPKSPTEEDMVKADTLLKHYDVPASGPPALPQVDFVAYLVRASSRGPADVASPGQPIPAVLQEAIAEMKRTFNYTDYTLLDTVETEVPGATPPNMSHHAQVENMLAGIETHGIPYFYEIDYGDVALSADHKVVSVNPFKFTVRVPVQGDNTLSTSALEASKHYQDSGVTTDVEIREGQKLVLGKVRTGLKDASDVFLVLTVKLH